MGSDSGLAFSIPAGLYELAPGASRWQSLGPNLEADPATVDIPGAGILWFSGFGGGTGLFPDAAA